MDLFSTLILAAAASFFWAAAVEAQEKLLPAAQNGSFEFTYFLRERPLDLGQLLGKHFSEVAPVRPRAGGPFRGKITWKDLSVPEEYKNPAIRYGVFVRPGLRDYMKSWDFMTDDYCVSNYSMFLMFFNRGFVFKVELRYISDSFGATAKSDDPKFCADEIPIFNMIAKKLGGTVIVRQGSHSLRLALLSSKLQQ